MQKLHPALALEEARALISLLRDLSTTAETTVEVDAYGLYLLLCEIDRRLELAESQPASESEDKPESEPIA